MVSAETFANADSLQKVMDKYQEMAKNPKVILGTEATIIGCCIVQAQKAHLTTI